jgi:hypothetical protein
MSALISVHAQYISLYLNKLEFPLPKDDLYQLSLIEIGWLVLEKLFSVFLLFLLLSPFGEECSPLFE